MTIRPYAERDGASLVALSLRAWAPVFASLEEALPLARFFRKL